MIIPIQNGLPLYTVGASNKYMKTKTTVILITLILFISSWLGIFIYQHFHNTKYGFLSVVRPLNFQMTTKDNKLWLDFTSTGRVFGLIELDFIRDNKEDKGYISAVVSEKNTNHILSSEKYSTVHVDNSKPLLISLGGKKLTKVTNYRLLIQTKPRFLLAQYLKEKNLHPSAVYFMDKVDLVKNRENILTIAKWKLEDVFRSFPIIYLFLLSLFTLTFPTLLYIINKRFNIVRAIRFLILRILRFTYVLPAAFGISIKNEPRSLSEETRYVLGLYARLLSNLYAFLLQRWNLWYGKNFKIFWEIVFVMIWVLANLTISLSKNDISNNYWVFILSYGVFSLSKRIDSKAQFIGAFVSLIFCPYFYFQGRESVAEKMAIFVYCFMVFGALTDAITQINEKHIKKY